MRLLADENIPGDAVAALRAAGHDVAWIRVDQPGSADRDVLARAQEENRILLTFDKDFGELAWRERLPAACGVVLFRLPMPAPTAVGRVIVDIVMPRCRLTRIGRLRVFAPAQNPLSLKPSSPAPAAIE